MFTLRSAPVIKDKRLLVQSSNNRMSPAKSVAAPNAMVSGRISCAAN